MAVAVEQVVRMPAPRLEELERDLAFVGALLAETLEVVGGAELPALVARLHQLSVRRREGDRSAARELAETVRSLSAESALTIARASSMQLQLANLCEELERLRRLRSSDRELGVPRAESLAALPALLHGLDHEERVNLFAKLDCRLVLTSHPSDATRRAVRHKLTRIRAALESLRRADLGFVGRCRLEDELRETLAIWWQTDEVRRVRPDVCEEVRRTLSVFESVLFDTAPEVVLELERMFGIELDRSPLSFGSWSGADMDGNPAVTSASVIATAREHRLLALRLLRDRVRRLTRLHTQLDSALGDNDRLTARVDQCLAELPGAAGLAERFRHEPIRMLLYLAWYRLGLTLEEAETGTPDEPAYSDPDELAADLELAWEASRVGVVRSRALRRLLWQVRIFGFHLASLDVREHAGRLRETVTALLPAYATAADENERIAALGIAIERRIAGCGEERLPDVLSRVPATFAAIQKLSTSYPDSIGTVIVSGTESASDVLCALWLLCRVGATTPIAPLFESGESLRGAVTTMQCLYELEPYRSHLRCCGEVQEVMLGYSDSAKDESFAAAQWSLYHTQEQLGEQAHRRGVVLRVHHGRGGSPARGGTRPHAAVLAQPAVASTGQLKMTEQGEVVTAKYSHPEFALRALEQTLSALVGLTGGPGPGTAREAWRTSMETIAAISRSVYRRLVETEPGFPRFFDDCSPLDLVAELPIGSRPASRSTSTDVRSLRAIPWTFAWMQNRILMPSWYGAGSGLVAVSLELEREMWEEWPFFNAFVSTLELALFKSDLSTGERYLRLASERDDAQRLWLLLKEEHQRTVDRVLAITDQADLLERRPAVRAGLPARNPWVDLLGDLQVELLGRYRGGDTSAREAALATVTGIAAGVQYTG